MNQSHYVILSGLELAMWTRLRQTHRYINNLCILRHWMKALCQNIKLNLLLDKISFNIFSEKYTDNNRLRIMACIHHTESYKDCQSHYYKNTKEHKCRVMRKTVNINHCQMLVNSWEMMGSKSTRTSASTLTVTGSILSVENTELCRYLRKQFCCVLQIKLESTHYPIIYMRKMKTYKYIALKLEKPCEIFLKYGI